MKFKLDPEYFTSMTVVTDHAKDLPEEERMLLRLRGLRHMSYRSEDHPEFAKLRTELEEKGFIKIQGSWWNGDKVIKPFTLNGSEFVVGDKFVSAPAMKYHIMSLSRLRDDK